MTKSKNNDMYLIKMQNDELNKLCESEAYKNASHEGKQFLSLAVLDKWEKFAELRRQLA
jgi:hypothetical protein